MTITALYQATVLALYAQIGSMANAHGVKADSSPLDDKFLSVENRNLYINGRKVIFLNENDCIDCNRYHYSTKSFESNGGLKRLIGVIDDIKAELSSAQTDESDASWPQDVIDELSNEVLIIGYVTEKDLIAKRISSIAVITVDEWEDGTGTEIIKDNQASYFRIDALDIDGKVLNPQ